MKAILIMALSMVLLSFYPAPAGDISVPSGDTVQPDITAYFYESPKYDNAIDRIAAHFYHDLELRSKDNPYNVVIISDESDDSAFNNESMYIIKVKIIKSGWNVDRSFYLPFIFFVYRNNYKMDVIAKIYRKDEANPRLTRRYNVKSKGPMVMQLFESNRHDSGLLVSYSRKTELESQAENKLGKMLANDLHNTIKKYRSR